MVAKGESSGQCEDMVPREHPLVGEQIVEMNSLCRGTRELKCMFRFVIAVDPEPDQDQSVWFRHDFTISEALAMLPSVRGRWFGRRTVRRALLR